MYFIDKFCFWTLWNYSNQFTSYDEYLHYECIIQTLFVKPTVCFFYLTLFILCLVSTIWYWSLSRQLDPFKFLVTDKNHTVILFLIWICYKTVTLMIHWSCIRRRGGEKTVFNTVCIWIICMVYTVCVVQRCLKLIFVFLRLKKHLPHCIYTACKIYIVYKWQQIKQLSQFSSVFCMLTATSLLKNWVLGSLGFSSLLLFSEHSICSNSDSLWKALHFTSCLLCNKIARNSDININRIFLHAGCRSMYIV